MNCPHFGLCGGCPSGGTPYSQQLTEKALPLAETLKISPDITSIGDSRLRDRVEVIWQISENGEKKLGLFKSKLKEILNLTACPMMSTIATSA